MKQSNREQDNYMGVKYLDYDKNEIPEEVDGGKKSIEQNKKEAEDIEEKIRQFERNLDREYPDKQEKYAVERLNKRIGFGEEYINKGEGTNFVVILGESGAGKTAIATILAFKYVNLRKIQGHPTVFDAGKLQSESDIPKPKSLDVSRAQSIIKSTY